MQLSHQRTPTLHMYFNTKNSWKNRVCYWANTDWETSRQVPLYKLEVPMWQMGKLRPKGGEASCSGPGSQERANLALEYAESG